VAGDATAVLLLVCPDQPGLVASVAAFVAEHGGNITHADQHVDAEVGVFFQRVEVDLRAFDLDRSQLAAHFETTVAARYGMRFDVRFGDERPRVALLVSKQPHCLVDVLGRWRAGELPADVHLVASNHPDHAETAAFFGVPYHHLPVTAGDKPAQERALLTLLERERIDLVVLARYMQVLSGGFVERYPDRIINIHHSFLPAFAGGRPYHQAYERGVKLIGATAHYATVDLDEGPIIDQDVTRITHRDTVDDLIRKGRDLERVVLARALRAHLEHRVLVYGRKTVVFG
jgi:formyltetrahydrofolate deformylase